MPSNQLDQVEIMTQPPAKYDAAGNADIINLITKKNKANVFNGTISLTAIFEIYFKNTNILNFNWRHWKINSFGQYGFSRGEVPGRQNTEYRHIANASRLAVILWTHHYNLTNEDTKKSTA